MDVPARVPEISSLLRHEGFVRALSRSLVRDGHDADDIEQDAWLAALRHPPADTDNADRWFARVVRNVASMRARGRARRDAHESVAARSEEVASHESALQALELHESVVRAVLNLREPYRDAIVACYFHGLSTREAAERARVPHDTLKTRVKRGLAQLREELDRRHGDRDTWLALALPFAGATTEPVLVGTVLGGVLAMKFVLASAVVLLTVVLWFAQRHAECSRGSEASALARAESSALDRGRAEPTSNARNERVAALDVEPRETHVELSASPTAPTGMFGTIVVLDESGVEHANENGLLRLRGAPPFTAGPFDVVVRDGRFQFASPPAHSLEPIAIELGGRAAYLRDVRGLEPRGPLALRATWIPPVVLSVVDAETGADLDGIVVLRDLIAWRGQTHPGEFTAANEWVRAAKSPLALPSIDGQRTYWVGAPEHAWKSIEIDHRSGGSRRIELARGARLTIECAPSFDDVDVRVRLYARDEPDQPSGQLDVPMRGTAAIELTGLTAGDYEVRAEVGMWYEGPRVLARADVGLVRGEHAHVRLALQSSDLAEPALDLAGTLELPAEIFGARVGLQWQRIEGAPLRRNDNGRLDLDRMVARGPSSIAWKAGKVSPGVYLISVDPFQWSQRIELVAPREIQLEVPEILRVEVRVTDSDSQASLPETSVVWARAKPASARVTYPQSATYDESARCFVLLAPAGRASIDFDEPDHERISKLFEVSRGMPPLDIALRRLPSFTLTLRDGEVNVPFSWAIHAEIVPEGHAGEALRRDTPGALAKFVVSEPGLYRIHIPRVDGFEEVPDRVERFDFGVPRAIEIPLVRR